MGPCVFVADFEGFLKGQKKFFYITPKGVKIFLMYFTPVSLHFGMISMKKSFIDFVLFAFLLDID